VRLMGMIWSTMATRVLFVPGFMQRGEAWRAVAELLPERYPSTLLDHRTHSYEDRLGEIAAEGEGAVLAGYSLGGRLALHAAVRDADRFAALVTVGTSAGMEDEADRIARRQDDERLAAWTEGRPIEDVVSVWERQPLFADQSDALVEEQRAGRLDHEPRELAELLRTAGQGALAPVWSELPRLELPLLALAGARDERYCAAARRMAKAAPRGRAAVVEQAGHAAQLQQPQTVARLVLEFLDQHFG
jgi:2-succinyl-6-hydroxy-2,4-cyclohexadiene-1-carboxylate synthase